MKIDIKDWPATAVIAAFCLYGLHRSSRLECGEQPLGTWLTAWYCIVLASRVLYIAATVKNQHSEKPNLFIVGILTFGVLLGVFASIWTFLGSGWAFRNWKQGNSCLTGFDLITALAIMSGVYLFYSSFIVAFLYFVAVDTQAATHKRNFFVELNRIYGSKKHAKQTNVQKFVGRYREVLCAELMMDIEEKILRDYCSEVVAENTGHDECSVCLLEFAGGEIKTKTSCGHAFHYDCVVGWYKLKPHCPYCRTSFREALLKSYVKNVM